MITIAHIEDNQCDHIALKRALSEHYLLIHFDNLEEFQNAKRCQIDLIIADLGLRESYGFETLKHLREICPDTPVLILSGLAGSFMTGDLMQALIEEGAQNVVSKDLLCQSHCSEILEELIKNILKKKGAII